MKKALSLCQIEHGSCAIHTLQLVINDGLFTQRFFNDILKLDFSGKSVIKLLEPCEQLTKDLSKDDSTISMVIPGYNNVLRQTLLCADDRGVQTIKQSLLESLDSRFIPYTTNVMYAAATILDPRFKTQFVNQSMLRHAREFIESKMNLQDQPVQAQVDSSSPVPAKKSMWDFLNDADSNEPENSIAVPTEFDSYLTQKNCPILQIL